MGLISEVSAGCQQSVQEHFLAAASMTATAMLVALVWRLYTPLHNYLVLSRIPHPRASNLLGNMEMLSPYQHRIFLKYAKQYGGVYTLRILWQKLTVIVDARYINIILSNSESLSKGLEPDNSDVLMSHRARHRTLFSSDTDSPYWTLIRKGTRGAFVQTNIKNGFPNVVKINEDVIDNLKRFGPGADVDLNNVTMRMAMDVTGLVGFAKDFGTCKTLDDSRTDDTFELLKAGMLECYRRAMDPTRAFKFWDKEARSGPTLFRTFKQKMVELKDEIKARGPVKDDDVSIAAHLLRLKEPETGEPLPDDLLAAEFGVYFAAGIESAGNAMTWTIYLLSQNPDVEAKLVKELDEAGFLATPGRPNPATMQYADLGKLTYLSWVCKEAMRCLPVASTGVTRKTKRALQLGQYTLPAGSLVVTPFFAAHHWEGNWPDQPDVFNPDRWAEPGIEMLQNGQESGDAASSKNGVRRFLPFSMGPRQCIGQSLARMMHDVGIAMLISHFHFQLAPKMGGPEGVLKGEINRLTLQPGLGLWVNCIPRATSNSKEASAANVALASFV